jgi:hypothetical protein
MPRKSQYRIYIAVHKGDPVDFSKYRHTGLWCVPVDGSSNYYYHVRGSLPDFRFEQLTDFDPTTSKTFTKKVEVGKTKRSLTSDELTEQMVSVDVLNNDAEFNCQQWVDFALRKLCDAGNLTEEQYNSGLNGMIDVMMEAEDEDLAH